MQNHNKKIVIVGGGTAGWMTANILVHSLKDEDFSISLVESPDVGIIGVGEGSTPALRGFFQTLNIEESEWMPECNATYKTGIQFNGWSTVEGYQKYFHAFPSSVDMHTQKHFFYNAQARAAGFDLDANPSEFYISAKIPQQKKLPIANDNFPFELDYAYHFDSHLLGKYLRKIAVHKGVEYIEGHVDDIKVSAQHDVQSVMLKDGSQIEGDFFVDCSGFRGLLINKMPGVAFVSYDEELLNDSAIAVPTPLEGNSIGAQTDSTALKYGWAWKIPLTNRYGNGYVYSSKYVSKEDAEKEFRAYLNVGDEAEVRHLSFRLGRNNIHWKNNCLAVGLSQGFIEPLEATGLALIQQTGAKFVQAFKKGNFTNKFQTQYNDEINADFDGIKDYIVLHYALSSRDDTPYWKDNAAHIQNVSSRLKELVNCWESGSNISEVVSKTNLKKYYPLNSWYAILAGYGWFPSSLKQPEANHNTQGLQTAQEFLRRCTQNYPEYSLEQ